MKKAKLVLMAIVMLALVGCSITPSTPIIGGFVDSTPAELTTIHNDILNRMVKVTGTAPYTYYVLDNGKIAGMTKPDGSPGWCSNYAAAVKAELLKSGYPDDQIEYVYCSFFDTKRPDHVVVMLNDKWIFDSNKMFLMERQDYPKKWTGCSGPGLEMTPMVPPYIWWACIDGEWVVTGI